MANTFTTARSEALHRVALELIVFKHVWRGRGAAPSPGFYTEGVTKRPSQPPYEWLEKQGYIEHPELMGYQVRVKLTPKAREEFPDLAALEDE